MFIWDFVADTVLGQIVDWIYGQMIGFLGNFFSLMGQMGAELFELDWIQSIVLFFSPDSCVFRSGCEVSEALKGTTERHGFPSRKYFSEAIAPIL